MTLLQTIQEICQGVEGYSFQFGEEGMATVLSDNTKLPCIYFEEYRKGAYNTGTYKSPLPSKSTTVELYFVDKPTANTATAREQLRETLENSGVTAFIDKYKEHIALGSVKEPTLWEYVLPSSKFGKGEVSVLLRFDCLINKC